MPFSVAIGTESALVAGYRYSIDYHGQGCTSSVISRDGVVSSVRLSDLSSRSIVVVGPYAPGSVVDSAQRAFWVTSNGLAVLDLSTMSMMTVPAPGVVAFGIKSPDETRIIFPRNENFQSYLTSIDPISLVKTDYPQAFPLVGLAASQTSLFTAAIGTAAILEFAISDLSYLGSLPQPAQMNELAVQGTSVFGVSSEAGATWEIDIPSGLVVGSARTPGASEIARTGLDHHVFAYARVQTVPPYESPQRGAGFLVIGTNAISVLAPYQGDPALLSSGMAIPGADLEGILLDPDSGAESFPTNLGAGATLAATLSGDQALLVRSVLWDSSITADAPNALVIVGPTLGINAVSPLSIPP